MTPPLQRLQASPADVPVEAAELATATDACLTCVQACTECADPDPIEQDVVTLPACIARILVCADISDAGVRVLSRPAQWDLLNVRDLRRGVSCLPAGVRGPAREQGVSGSWGAAGDLAARAGTSTHGHHCIDREQACH